MEYEFRKKYNNGYGRAPRRCTCDNLGTQTTGPGPDRSIAALHRKLEAITELVLQLSNLTRIVCERLTTLSHNSTVDKEIISNSVLQARVTSNETPRVCENKED